MFTLFLFYIVVLNEFTIGKTSKLNVKTVGKDCQRCKILTNSYDYWLERTSRGKFEGGDAAWEEANLKSYARSEIRLVEVLEGLCSELKKGQDQCYALNEEVEQVIESWWALDNSTLVDLYTWLCIEQLKYCCPKNHFGENCQICPSKNNKMCNNHGQCYGEGTRQGNGSCICTDGYKGENCDECSDNFFSDATDTCNPCNKACNGCHGHGPMACKMCAVGWILDTGECVDIDECHSSLACKRNQFCVNNEGSYICIACHKSCDTCKGTGSLNCSSCDSEKVLLAGECVSNEVLKQTLKNVVLRIFLYFSLIILSIVIFKKSKSITTLGVLGISIIIFYLEQRFEINISHVILNYSDVLDRYNMLIN